MRLLQLLNQIIIACLLLIGSSMLVVAHAADNAKISADATKVYWPMMRGESVQGLAKALYPDSPILRKRFIDKTRSMSHTILPDLDVKKAFPHAQMIVIPNERAVRELTHKIKRYQDVRPQKKTDQTQKMNFSYSLNSPPPVSPSTNKSANKTAPLKLPEVSMPDIEMPEIKVPEVNMPHIESGTIKTALSNFWYRLSTGFQNLIQKTKHFLIKTRDMTGTFLAAYKGKDLKAVMNDYHLRNAALLAMLVIMGIGLLVFSKRHTKQHAQSLGALSDTIRPVQQQETIEDDNNDARKEPTIELPEVEQETINVDEQDPVIHLATLEPELAADDQAIKEDVDGDIPTLNEAVDIIVTEEPPVELETKLPEINKPEIATVSVKPEDSESKTVNIVIDTAEQLKEVVNTEDSEPFLGEVSIHSVPSRKK